MVNCNIQTAESHIFRMKVKYVTKQLYNEAVLCCRDILDYTSCEVKCHIIVILIFVSVRIRTMMQKL